MILLSPTQCLGNASINITKYMYVCVFECLLVCKEASFELKMKVSVKGNFIYIKKDNKTNTNKKIFQFLEFTAEYLRLFMTVEWREKT